MSLVTAHRKGASSVEGHFPPKNLNCPTFNNDRDGIECPDSIIGRIKHLFWRSPIPGFHVQAVPTIAEKKNKYAGRSKELRAQVRWVSPSTATHMSWDRA